jgi:hypothetical protein
MIRESSLADRRSGGLGLRDQRIIKIVVSPHVVRMGNCTGPISTAVLRASGSVHVSPAIP